MKYLTITVIESYIYEEYFWYIVTNKQLRITTPRGYTLIGPHASAHSDRTNRVQVSIHPIDVIQHKRDGLTLSDAEIQAFIRALVHRTPENPTPTDAQTAALN